MHLYTQTQTSSNFSSNIPVSTVHVPFKPFPRVSCTPLPSSDRKEKHYLCQIQWIKKHQVKKNILLMTGGGLF